MLPITDDPFSIITPADLPELEAARAAGDQDAAITLKCIAEFPRHVGVDYLAPGLDKGERDTVTVAGKACMNCREVEFSLDKMPKAYAISIMRGEAFVGGLCEACLQQRTEHERRGATARRIHHIPCAARRRGV